MFTYMYVYTCVLYLLCSADIAYLQSLTKRKNFACVVAAAGLISLAVGVVISIGGNQKYVLLLPTCLSLLHYFSTLLTLLTVYVTHIQA
jgi:hypothetical protein